MRSRPTFILSLSALLWPLLWAGNEPASHPCNLAEVFAAVEARHPSLAAWRAEERAVDALAAQATQRPPPSLEVSAENFLGTREARAARLLEATVQVQQTWERAEKRQSRRREVEATRRHVRADLAQAWHELQTQTAAAWVALLESQGRLALAERRQHGVATLLATVTARVRQGEAPPADLSRARAELARAEASTEKARQTLLAAQTDLSALWGGSAEECRNLPMTWQWPPSLEDVPADAELMRGHPSWVAQHAALEVQQAALASAHSQTRPDLALGGGVRFLREDSSAALVASVSLPLFTSSTQQPVLRATRARIERAEHDLVRVQWELQRLLQQATLRLRAAHAQAQRWEHNVLPSLTTAAQETTQAYQSGLVDYLAVLTAEAEIAEAEEQLLDARSETLHALRALESLLPSGFRRLQALSSSP